MKKDFLFFNYSYVKNSTFFFKSFEKKGHNIDIVDENTLNRFCENIHNNGPEHTYKNVVLYLHENQTIPLTNYLIDNYFSEATLIQHDDTDLENVQIWSNKQPRLIMQREQNEGTANPWKGSRVMPHHFPILLEDAQDNEAKSTDDRPYDVVFMANRTNPRRNPFIDKVLELSQSSLKHLNWAIDVDGFKYSGTPSSSFKHIGNRSKIGLHYFGNSYDAWRIWELAAMKAAIVMPRFRNLSASGKHYAPFKDYCEIRDDFSDLEEKILFLLKEDNFKKTATRAYNNFIENHEADAYFNKYYYPTIMESSTQ
jgi:hypothetical protein